MSSLDRDVGLEYTSNLVTIVYRDGKLPNLLYYKIMFNSLWFRTHLLRRSVF
jgi:hypothetical protein